MVNMVIKLRRVCGLGTKEDYTYFNSFTIQCR